MERKWESTFLEYFTRIEYDSTDASHDLGHFRRVANTAKEINGHEPEPADSLILLAAAYFHDIVSLPKNHPDNKMSSRYAADKAKEILTHLNFPREKIDSVSHAIHAHSFSANVTPETLEAKIIQDADRMEALGALGIMRTFYVSGRLGRAPYHKTDLFAKGRPLDDKSYGLDHFYCKLFKLPDLLQTEGGRRIASRRAQFLHLFVDELVGDIEKEDGGALQIVNVCYEAGEGNMKLFDMQDAFARNRKLEPEKFIVDRLMGFSMAFVSRFLNELEGEVNER